MKQRFEIEIEHSSEPWKAEQLHIVIQNHLNENYTRIVYVKELPCPIK